MSDMIKTKFGNARINASGYYQISSRKEGNHGKFLHRLIYEDYYNISLIDGVILHHIDRNRANNHIDNLTPMYSEEHSVYHNLNHKLPIESCIKISKNQGSTGFYRVSKCNDDNTYMGYYWRYTYYDENFCTKSLCNVDLNVLKSKVEKEGLFWAVTDVDKAKKSLTENEDYVNLIKQKKKKKEKISKSKKEIGMSISKSNTSTGLYRVSKSKRKDTKQGYLWEYTAYVDGKRKRHTSTNLNKLYKKVIDNGLDWIIIDEDKAKKSRELNNIYHKE